MISKREYGSAGERRARDYLLGQGFAFVAANYHTRYGEVDLVMRDGGELVFVEVKTRRGGAAGHPAEAVNAAKLRHTVRAAGFFRREHAIRTPWRIDVVAITDQGEGSGDHVEHFRNVTA